MTPAQLRQLAALVRACQAADHDPLVCELNLVRISNHLDCIQSCVRQLDTDTLLRLSAAEADGGAVRPGAPDLHTGPCESTDYPATASPFVPTADHTCRLADTRPGAYSPVPGPPVNIPLPRPDVPDGHAPDGG